MPSNQARIDRRTHARWAKSLPPGFIERQCGQCRYFIQHTERLLDWGACTCATSEYDQTVTFEHFGCKEWRV